MKQLDLIESLLPEWLVKQRWFQKDGDIIPEARIVDSEWLSDSWPRLLWTLIEVDGGATYQAPLGLRRRELIGPVLLGHPDALIGDIDIEDEETVVYDALIDSELDILLFDLIVDDKKEEVQSVRSSGAEQTNTSLIFDNRLILKVFRRLHPGPNPDMEVTRKLTELGFPHVKPVIATWERGDHDLAVCQPFLWDGTDGWKMALASVRDFLRPEAGGSAITGSVALVEDSSPDDPASAGGDFGEEVQRLGEVTASMHLALADAFASFDFDPTHIASLLEARLPVVEESQRDALRDLVEKVRALSVGKAGRATRVHGDYHLGQTLRAVTGWFVMDFEGEPMRPLSERNAPDSPLKDVAGMLRSLQYATAAGIAEQMQSEQASFQAAAAAWEKHNSEKFQRGYFSVDGIETLLPEDEGILHLLLRAFETEKAIYELEYERTHRPDWISIPQGALKRLLG